MGTRNIEGNYKEASDLNADVMPGWQQPFVTSGNSTDFQKRNRKHDDNSGHKCN